MEVVGAVTGVILTLAAVIATMGWLLRGSFKDQREAAREFTALIAENRKENEEDRRQRKTLEDELDRTRMERREDRERIEHLEAALKASEKSVNELKRIDAQREAEKVATVAIIRERDERIERLDKRVATLEKERDALQKERTDLRAEVERLRCADQERDALAVQVADLQRVVDKLEKRGTGPLPDLAEAAPAQPEPGEESTEAKAESGEDKPNGSSAQ